MNFMDELSKQREKSGKVEDPRPVGASKSAQNGLTGIPDRIQCLASRNTQEAGYDELDSIAVEYFLTTLAEIALSVAAREAKEEQERDD
jgi:hypothetical protein